MKKTSTLLAISSALVLSNAAQAEIEGEVHVGYNTDYVFRGADLGENAVEVGADINGSLSCGIDWSLGIWYINPDSDSGLDEIDFYGEISKDLGFGTLALGFINYQFSNTGGSDDDEIYVAASTEFAGLEAGLTLTFGVSGLVDDAVFLEGSLAKGFDISDKFSGEVSLGAGYIIDEGDAGNYYATDGYAYGTLTVSGSYALTDQVSINPYISYTEGEDGIYLSGGQDFRFTGAHGGVSIAVSF